jgi:ketosteroid isomerase-like protein
MKLPTALLLATLLAACQTPTPPVDLAQATAQVQAAERAFAQTMADRDHAAFSRHLADEAVFFTTTPPLRGKAQVAAHWARFFTAPQAPFSWEPDEVEVLASGTLAHSSGPVRDANGKRIARFHSVWRQEAPGVWRIVFDRGEAVSDGAGR